MFIIKNKIINEESYGTSLPWVFFYCVCVGVCAHPSSDECSCAFYNWLVLINHDR